MAPDARTEPAPLDPPIVRSGRLRPIIIVTALMALEGVGVYFLADRLGEAPASALAMPDDGSLPVGASGDDAGGAADRTQGTAGGATDDFAEVQVAECKPSNVVSGKLIICHIRVTALVKSADLARTQALVQARKARLEDCVNTVIRSAEPKHLNEPGLETIKRRLKHELDTIFGDDKLVRAVLIPQLLPSGRGF